MFDILETAIDYVGSAVNRVVNIFSTNANLIEDEINAPLREIIAQVEGGIWKGAGADAFVASLREHLPRSTSIANSLNAWATSLNNAANSLEEADSRAAGEFRGLDTVFSEIYKP